MARPLFLPWQGGKPLNTKQCYYLFGKLLHGHCWFNSLVLPIGISPPTNFSGIVKTLFKLTIQRVVMRWFGAGFLCHPCTNRLQDFEITFQGLISTKFLRELSSFFWCWFLPPFLQECKSLEVLSMIEFHQDSIVTKHSQVTTFSRESLHTKLL